MSDSSRAVPVGAIRLLGDAALVVGTEDAAAAQRLGAAIERAHLAGVTEVVVGLETTVVLVDPVRRDAADLIPQLQRLVTGPGDTGPTPDETTSEIVIEASFAGPDLDHVAHVAGLSTEAVVARFLQSSFTVATVGFSPGFAYLSGLDPALAEVGRRLSPRASVPAGSVALAAGLAAVYPQATPGGWQIIGHTERRMFNPALAPYSLLRAGDRVRFTESEPSADTARPETTTERSLFRGSTRPMVVLEPGISTTVQDGARVGLASIGVPGAGPADPISHELANALVGNRSGTAALEVTARGPTLEFGQATHIAVVGAPVTVTLDGRELPTDRVVPVMAGQILAVGQVRPGLHCYVAVAGGIEGETVMGSLSTDALTGLGPGPLLGGDVLAIGTPVGVLGDHLTSLDTEESSDDVAVLRMVAGPNPELFARSALEQVVASDFVVGPKSNRVGLRLAADRPISALVTSGQIASLAMVTGALQVPPDGQPVLLGCDHGTTGGYPVLAVVITADQGRVGQLQPGDQVRFQLVDHEQARHEFQLLRRRIDRAVVGHYPTIAD